MNFGFDDEQDLLRETTRRFLEERHPLAVLRPVLEAEDPFDRATWRSGAELGWTAPLIPEAYGGGSVTHQPLVDLVVLAEELGAVLYPGPFASTSLVANAIARGGTEHLRRELLPRIAAGELVGAWAMSGDGTVEVSAIDVRARRGATGWVLDGTARYVPDANVADVVIVEALAAGAVHRFVVRRPSPGVELRVMRTIDLTRRHCDLTLNSVAVDDDALLVVDDADFVRTVELACVLQCAEDVGAADALFRTTVQYAKDREQFGRPIGSFQVIKHKLADLLIRLEAMRVAVYDAALAVTDGASDAAVAVSAAASYVGDAFSELCGEALQVHGGIGFTWESDVHLFLRRAKSDAVRYGDPAWHRERLFALLERAS